jgi:hypothetical protein
MDETKHSFTPAEASHFLKLAQEINGQQIKLRGAIELAIAQNGLEGSWQLSADATGLVRVDDPTREVVSTRA